MTHQEDDLRIQTAAAVRQATSELRNDAGNSELFGFALCTDDDVRTLHQVACTRDWVRENEAGYPDIGFIYVEWTHSAGDALFDPISQQFATLADQKYTCDEDWAAARDRRFNLLVMALEDCRNAGVFAPDTLLCVGAPTRQTTWNLSQWAVLTSLTLRWWQISLPKH